jgi:hypothetical protein
MKVESFEFKTTIKGSGYTVFVKRFAVAGEKHLWTLVRDSRSMERVFNFYETGSPDKLLWHPLNDKRDELIKAMEAPMIRKIKTLEKK